MADRINIQSLAVVLIAAAVIVAGLVIVALADPFDTDGSLLPRCVVRETTGYLCPGCGSGRATHSLLHRRWALAWRCNPLFVIALPLMAAGLVNEAVRAVRGRPIWRWRMPGRWMLAIAVVILGFGIIRNLPYSALDALRPPSADESREVQQQ